MAYTRRNTTDGVTVMNKDLYDNLQDGIEQFGITPQMFGAVGDGVHDDTEAFQQMLSSNRNCYIPNGVYRITQPLVINKSIMVFGEHCSNTILMFELRPNQYCLSLNCNYGTLSNFKIIPKNYDWESSKKVGSCDFNGISVEGKQYTRLKNLTIAGFLLGLNLGDYSYDTEYDELLITNCATGVFARSESNAVHFTKCKIKYCGIGVDKQSGNSFVILNCDIERNDLGISMQNTGDITVIGTYFELNKKASIETKWGLSSIDQLFISGCNFFEDSDCETVFDLHAKQESKIIVENCNFRSLSNLASGSITVVKRKNSNAKFVPYFLNNLYSNAYTLDKSIIIDESPKAIYKEGFTRTLELDVKAGFNSFSFTPPNTPTGYKLSGSEFIRTDTGAFTVLFYVCTQHSYLVCSSEKAISVKGYIKYKFVKSDYIE